MPKVSIIVPVYNVEKYLRECLDSLINQTLTDIEIICINDGSTDGSLNILQEYSQIDSRIKIINKQNSGYGNSMNIGFEQALGEYIGIVESDDFIALDMYEKLYNLSQLHNAEIVKSNYYSVSDEGVVKVNKFVDVIPTAIYKNIEIPEYANKNHPCIWTAIYRNDFIKKYDIKFSNTSGAAFQDVGFNIKTWLYADKITVTDEAFYYYRINNLNSSVNQGNKMAFVTLNEYKLLYKHICEKGFSDDLICVIDFKCCTDLVYNYHTRLTKNHLKFILDSHKLFNMHDNNLITDEFYNAVKYHPFLFYLSKLFYMKKKKNRFKSKIYLLKMPVISVRNTERHKIYRILFFKFAIRDKSSAQDNVPVHYDFMFNIFQNMQIEKYIDKKFNVKELIKSIKFPPKYLNVDNKHNFLNILINQKEFSFDCTESKFDNVDEVYLCWEINPSVSNFNIINQALKVNKPVIYAGDSFLRSINTYADRDALPKYQKGISFTLDDLTCFFDATRPSRLEQMLNDTTLVLTDEQRQRARRCINKIVETHLTKYNHQPIFTPEIGRKNAKKVLVVDQTYRDMSVLKGIANEKTFKDMLSAAVKENPDADIIVKTHPDTIAAKDKKGYYSGMKEFGNIYLMTAPINPISLIKYCDKVYVCTTQLGFEALMCNKETHVFGMPFYSGWGITHDRLKCQRRQNKRSLEEVFYIAYIMYSHYVNPKTSCCCEIEEAIDYLLDLRAEYFSKYCIC